MEEKRQGEGISRRNSRGASRLKAMFHQRGFPYTCLSLYLKQTSAHRDLIVVLGMLKNPCNGSGYRKADIIYTISHFCKGQRSQAGYSSTVI